MSVFREHQFDCPSCGHVNTETVAASLHGPRVPEVVEAILAGTFQVFACARCGLSYRADGPVIYTDFDEKHWIGEFPASDEVAWATLEQHPMDSFRRAMIDFAPAFLRADAAGFTIRTVFGLPALAEKILLLRNGWDDRVVEAMKLRLVLESGTVLHPASRPAVVEADAERLSIAMPGGIGALTVTRADADAFAADPAWREGLAAMARGPYVDLGRLMLEGRAESIYAAAS
jgi:CpXC protein